jgi:hypothetical protein
MSSFREWIPVPKFAVVRHQKHLEDRGMDGGGYGHRTFEEREQIAN